METDREFSTVVSLPNFPGPSVVTRHAAAEDPDQSTAGTVAIMERCAREDSGSPQVFGATSQALRGAGASREQMCGAIYRWIASHVKFRSDDPVIRHVFGLDNELDLLIRPARLLTMNRPAEDCDGFTMLACSMLLCAGIPCEIVTIKADHDDPDRFSHVYCQAILDQGDLCMDCSQAAQHGFPIGWEAPEYFDRQTWGVMHPEVKEKKGMQGLGECMARDDSGSCTYDDNTGSLMGNTPKTVGSPSIGSALDWNNIINKAFTLGSQFGLKPGQYVQNAQGVMSSNVPGAIPGQFPGTAVNLGGISSSTILLGVAALGAVLIFSGRR